MHIEVRDYRSEDWPFLEDIILHAENFGEGFVNYEKLRTDVFLKNPEYGTTLVAYDTESGKIVGFIAIQFEWMALVICSIITHHKHLRHGVGRAMIEKVKEIGRSHPIADIIRVDTGDFMEYAQQFYRSCGFEQAAYVPHYMSWNNHQMIFVQRLQRQ